MIRSLSGLVLAVAAVVSAAPASAALTIYGLKGDGTNTIAVFKSDTPGVFIQQIQVSGLQGTEKLAAITFDQRTGVLFGFGHNPHQPNSDDDTGRFYVINRVTGVATQLQGGLGQPGIFTNMADARYSFWDEVDPSFAMHIDPNQSSVKVTSWDGEVLRYDLYDATIYQYFTGNSNFGEQVAASAVLTDFYDGDTARLYIVVDEDDGQLELQRNDDSGFITNLVDGFNIDDAANSHVGFDIHGFSGFVSYTQGGVTRLYSMDLFPWWDNSNDPTLTTVGIIGTNGDVPVTALAILPGSGYIAVGRGDIDGPGKVRVINPSLDTADQLLIEIPAFGSGGARVAMGDVNGDGFPEVIAAPGAGPVSSVKVYDGEQLINEGIVVQILTGFNPTPFGATYKQGLYLAAGDASGDGLDDIVVGTGAGVAKFKIVVSDSQLTSVAVNVANTAGGAFDDGGARVGFGFFNEIDEAPPAAVGVNCGCPIPYVIVGSGVPTATSRVALFDAGAVAATTFTNVPDFDVARLFFNVPNNIIQGTFLTGPVFVAACTIDNDGDHFIIGRGTGSSTVKVIDPDSIEFVDVDGFWPRKGQVNFIEASFQAFTSTDGGVRVGAAVLDMLKPPFTPTNFEATILTGRGNGVTNGVRGFPNGGNPYPGGYSPLFDVVPFPSTYKGGVFVAGALGIRGCGNVK